METKERADQRFLEKLRMIIKENMDDHEFSMEKLCQQTALSRSQVYRKVKVASGLSIALFVRQVRLEEAKKLLSDTSLSISEVSYKCGITSPPNFTKYFTAEFGCTPSEYRKSQLTHNTERVSKDGASSPVIREKSEPEDNPITHSIKRFPSFQNAAVQTIMVWILLGVLFLLSIYAILNLPEEKAAAIDNPPVTSIAVLPFKNFNSLNEDFLAEGVVEDVLTHLTKFRNLRVISRTSSEQYKDSEKNLPQIGEELDVEYILEGSIRQFDEKIRITTQLIEASSDRHIWAKNYDRSRADIMNIQSEIALDVARSLNQEMEPAIEQSISAPPTDNAEAYQLVLRGRYLLRTRKKEAMEASIVEFDRAIAIDSSFSDAYVGKAAASYLLRDVYFEPSTADQNLQEAKENAQLAISHDRSNAQAFAYLGLVYQAQYNWAAAASTFEVALSLNPSDALINYWYGNVFRAMGKVEEALKYQAIANELDPLYPVINAGYIYTCALTGRHELANKLLDEWHPVFGQSFLHETVRGYNLLLQGIYEEAIPHFEKSLSYNPNFRLTRNGRIYCLGKLGRTSEVEAYLDEINKNAQNDYRRAAMACLSIGQEEKAVAMLRKAADKRLIDTDILIDPRYAPILRHPTVLQVLREFGLYRYLPDA